VCLCAAKRTHRALLHRLDERRCQAPREAQRGAREVHAGIKAVALGVHRAPGEQNRGAKSRGATEALEKPPSPVGADSKRAGVRLTGL